MFHLFLPCWVPRPGRGRGTECVIANLSFISFGCFCVTWRVPFSQLICTSWKYSNYPANASDPAREDERAVKAHLSFMCPGELFTDLIQTQIKGPKELKLKIRSLCKNPIFPPPSSDLKNKKKITPKQMSQQRQKSPTGALVVLLWTLLSHLMDSIAYSEVFKLLKA